MKEWVGIAEGVLVGVLLGLTDGITVGFDGRLVVILLGSREGFLVGAVVGKSGDRVIEIMLGLAKAVAKVVVVLLGEVDP